MFINTSIVGLDSSAGTGIDYFFRIAYNVVSYYYVY